MSTRATIHVIDNGYQGFTVYRHNDGYPDGEHGVVEGLRQVVKSGYAWDLPRFESDDFAAAIIACWKTKSGGGNICCARGHGDHSDTEWRYDLEFVGGQLVLTWDPEYHPPTEDMTEYQDREAKGSPVVLWP